MMRALVLGLAVGPTCLAYCAPALAPYLLAEGKTVRASAAALGQFLLGRLCGYLLFAVLVWWFHELVLQRVGGGKATAGIVFLGLAGLLAWYGLRPHSPACVAQSVGARSTKATCLPMLLPASMGFLTGVNLCPPFLVALAEAARVESLAESVGFFLAFFLGTAVYFLPAPLLGALGRAPALKTAGRLATLVMAVYYGYLGSMLLALEAFA
jgi:hypothetical protein